MDKEVIIVTTEKQLEETFLKIFQKVTPKQETDFTKEKLTRTQAQKLVGLSTPTFANRIKEGFFKEYGSGRKKFYIKSELIEALKNN